VTFFAKPPFTTIEMILSTSANINQRTLNLETPLILAAKNCLTENVQTLARFNSSEYGIEHMSPINVHLTDIHNKTALHYAAMNCDNRDIMLVLLQELNANVYDVDSDDRTPLFLATEREMNNEAIPVLIEYGSDVSYKSGNLSIICDTIYRQNFETTVLLIKSRKLIKTVVLECILELGIHTDEAGELGSRWLAEYGADESFLVSISRGDTVRSKICVRLRILVIFGVKNRFEV